MASSVVFKVKYEDTLRRFNARVDENQLLDLDMAGLRAKIRSLFDFTADADLKLTYLDEDHDKVDLVDEEDLRDLVRQELDPVRIFVKLNTGKAGSTVSSGLSTPIRPRGHTLSPDINAGFADILKSVPEPLRETLSRLSAEATSKAASTSPILAELVESITKVGQSFLNAHPAPQSGPADLAASQELGGAAPNSDCTKAPDFVNVTKSFDGSATAPVCVNQPMPNQKKFADANWEALQSRSQSHCDRRKGKGIIDDCKKHEKGSSSDKETTIPAVPKLHQRIPVPRECPFAGFPMTAPPNHWFPPAQQGPHGPVFHRGVQCDACGVYPITGPRFKSKVKENYDLCTICFKQMGNDADYQRMDVAASFRHPGAMKMKMGPRPWAHHPPQPLFPHFGKHKQLRPKLDSRFIVDVNVMDGTVMAPKTTFTKIWRMRNSGNIPWPRGFQLVWIGGDKFSNTDSVEIEYPAAGAGFLYPEGEVDVAVEFIAPELPGRYISYWKVASPTGQKFGQRVWVLIQVDATLTDASSAVPVDLNLNLPPMATTGDNTRGAIDMNVEPLVDVHYEPTSVHEQQNKLNMLPEDEWYFHARPLQASTLPNLPNHILEAMSASKPVSASQPTSTVTYPTVDPSPLAFGVAEVLGPADMPVGSAVDVPAGKTIPTDAIPVETSGHNVEEALLKELEEMGFKQTNLNKLVLKRNDFNLEQSLDELCGFSEWDLLLEELQGMGFVNREMNEKALAKNNGSIKHAVMDLITRENA